MKLLRFLLLAFLCLCLPFLSKATSAQTTTITSTITSRGITWTLRGSPEKGQFVNGDWYVIGPVELISISPMPNNRRHGSWVNPLPGTGQPFDYRRDPSDTRSAGYNPNLAGAITEPGQLPKTLVAGDMLLSIESHPEADPNNPECVYKPNSPAITGPGFYDYSGGCSLQVLKRAEVLTVLSAHPPANSFRPSYAGPNRNRKIHTEQTVMDQFNSSKLPRLPLPQGQTPPNINGLARQFERLWLDIRQSWAFRFHHPSENMPDYGSELVSNISNVGLVLMLDHSYEEIRPLLINFIQAGIDFSGTFEHGGWWGADGGHFSGRKFIILFAGHMLNDADILDRLQNSSYDPNKTATYAFSEDCQTYYNSRGVADYGILACFKNPIIVRRSDGTTYDKRFSNGYETCCNTQYWVGEALAARLINRVDTWNNPSFFDYIDNWMNGSGATQSSFVSAMWRTYRHRATDDSPPTAIAGLQASARTESSITLSWQSAADPDSGVSYYYVYRNGERLDTKPRINTFTDEGLSEGTTYAYQVSAVNGAGMEGARSASIQAATTADTTPPVASKAYTTSINTMQVRFSEPVDANTAENPANYVISPNIAVQRATLGSDLTSVTLLTGNHVEDEAYNISIRNIRDRAKTPNTMRLTIIGYVFRQFALVASYQFNEGSGTLLKDFSGNGHDGTVSGAQWATNQNLTALNFTGAQDHIVVPSFDAHPEGLTISVLFDMGNLRDHDARLVSKSTGTAENDHYWMLSTILDDGQYKLRFRLKTNGQTSTLIADSGALNATEGWVHAVATYDGQEMRLYKNGTLVGMRAKQGTISQSSQIPVRLGQNPNGYGSFVGHIAEIKIFEQAITPEQVLSSGSKVNGGNPPGNAPQAPQALRIVQR